MKKAISGILEGLAKDKGITVQQLKADMTAAIHTAAISDNPETRRRFFERFKGREPSPEEFIMAIAHDASLSAYKTPGAYEKHVS